MGALPRWHPDGWLHLDTVARTIGVLSNHAPVITTGVMHPFADLLVGDIQRSVAVWARDDHPLIAFSSATHAVHRYRVDARAIGMLGPSSYDGAL